MVSGEALKARCDFPGVLWPGVVTHLANPQGPDMAVLYWRLREPMGYLLPSPSMRATKPLLFLFSCFLKPNAAIERPSERAKAACEGPSPNSLLACIWVLQPAARDRRPILASDRRLVLPCTRSHSGRTKEARNHRSLGFPLWRVRGRWRRWLRGKQGSPCRSGQALS